MLTVLLIFTKDNISIIFSVSMQIWKAACVKSLSENFFHVTEIIKVFDIVPLLFKNSDYYQYTQPNKKLRSLKHVWVVGDFVFDGLQTHLPPCFWLVHVHHSMKKTIRLRLLTWENHSGAYSLCVQGALRLTQSRTVLRILAEWIVFGKKNQRLFVVNWTKCSQKIWI